MCTIEALDKNLIFGAEERAYTMSDPFLTSGRSVSAKNQFGQKSNAMGPRFFKTMIGTLSEIRTKDRRLVDGREAKR